VIARTPILPRPVEELAGSICHKLWQKDFTAASFLKIFETKKFRARSTAHCATGLRVFPFSLKQFEIRWRTSIMHWIAPSEKMLTMRRWKNASGMPPTSCAPIPN
jgi:hypothetical protein